MVIIEFSFPAKRFHTTPWGSNVNEGMVEWPPSPWRILRGLIATWHLKCKKEVPEPIMREIINELSQKPLHIIYRRQVLDIHTLYAQN
jgi:CRISPR-associated protein Csb2